MYLHIYSLAMATAYLLWQYLTPQDANSLLYECCNAFLEKQFPSITYFSELFSIVLSLSLFQHALIWLWANPRLIFQANALNAFSAKRRLLLKAPKRSAESWHLGWDGKMSQSLEGKIRSVEQPRVIFFLAKWLCNLLLEASPRINVCKKYTALHYFS